MQTLRKRARERLQNSTLTEFKNIISEAKLTPRQNEILEMKFLQDFSCVQMSFELCVDVGTIKHDLIKIYDRVGRMLRA